MFEVAEGAVFAATSGTDEFVNKGSLANGGSVSLANDASWTQEAGTSSETGNPIVILNSGQLTDVSGAGAFDLIDTAVLSGTVPEDQTVTADAIPSHNAEVKVSGTVTNEGTLALDSPAGRRAGVGKGERLIAARQQGRAEHAVAVGPGGFLGGPSRQRSGGYGRCRERRTASG